MRQVFIRHRDTKLLLTDQNAWTGDGAKAKDFRTSLNSLAFCLQHELTHAEILVRFNLPGVRDVTVPITSGQKTEIERQLSRTMK